MLGCEARGINTRKEIISMLSNEQYISFVLFPQASEPTMNLNLSKLVYSLNYKEMYGDQSAE